MTLVEQVLGLRHTMFRMLSRRVAEVSDRPMLQLRVLRAVAVHKVRSQADVADFLMIDTGAVSRLVDRLEEDGLMRRTEGENRRCVKLEVTADGRAEVETLSSALTWVDRKARKHLTPEEADTLQRLQAKLGEALLSELAD